MASFVMSESMTGKPRCGIDMVLLLTKVPDEGWD